MKSTEPTLESYEITFNGKVLGRGFWLYVIQIDAPEGRLTGVNYFCR